MQFDPNHPHLALLPPVPSTGSDDKGPIALGALALRSGDAWGALTRWLPLADRGDVEAKFLAGTLLALGGRGVTQDLAGAEQLLCAAAAVGYARAAFNAGLVGLRRIPVGAAAPALPTIVALFRLAGQSTEDHEIQHRVHRLAGAISRELPDGGDPSVRLALERIRQIGRAL